MRNLTPIAIMTLAMTIAVVRIVFPSAPRGIGYLVDGLIAATTVFVIARIIVDRTWSLIPGRYLFVMMSFTYVCIAGIVLNDVPGDTTFAGVRMYFRYVPLFLLPFAFRYDEIAWRPMLSVLLVILLLQIPVTVVQRFFLFTRSFTGDTIGGTFGSSTSVAILSCIGILFLLSAYLSQRLTAGKASVLALGLLIPPSLSETKVTPILLLAGGAVVAWSMRDQLNMKRLVSLGLLGALGLSLFIGVYGVLYSREGGEGYLDIMTDPTRNYHYKGIEIPELEIPRERNRAMANQYDPTSEISEDEGRLGRIDSLGAPFRALGPQAPIHLFLGLGIGNTSSNFGGGGSYLDLNASLSASLTTLSQLIWETGILGCLLFVMFIWFVSRDILRASRRPDLIEASLAKCLIGGVAIVWICLAYTNLFFKEEVMIPFCFLSGLVIANLRRAETQAASLAMERTTQLPTVRSNINVLTDPVPRRW